MTLNASFILFIFIIPEFQLMKEPFTAAVVDYQPIRHKRDTPVAVIEKNVEKYIELIESAQQKGIQIIVFPEAGLTTNEYLNSSILHIYSHRISDDMIDKDLCSLLNSEDDDYILKKLSCAAKASYMYVVLTLIELEGENENEKFFVSTIAFDFCGRLIKKMRKLDLHTNKVLEEMEELNIPFGNFAIIPNIDYLFTMNNATTDKYYILSSLYDSNEKLSEIIKVHSFGANDFNILCSSYLHYDKGYLGSIISSARKSYTKSTDNLIILEIHPEDTPKQSLVQLVNSKNISKYVNDHLLHPNITKDNMNDTKTNITCNVNIVPQDKIEIINYTRISIGDESYKFCGIRQNEEKTGAFDTSTIRSINISLTINNRSIHIPTSIPITYCNTSLPIEQFEYSVGTDKLLLTGNDIRCKTGHLILIGILTRYKNDTNVDNNSSTQKPASGKVPIGNGSPLSVLCIFVPIFIIPTCALL